MVEVVDFTKEHAVLAIPRIPELLESRLQIPGHDLGAGRVVDAPSQLPGDQIEDPEGGAAMGGLACAAFEQS